MSRVRRVGFVVGIALVLAGLGVALAPGLVGEIRPANAYLTIAGTVALVSALFAVHARITATDDRPMMPTPERKPVHPTPGDEFDRKLGSLGSRGRLRGARERRAVRNQLTETAIAVLVRDGLSETAAREALVRGTWTDDPHAAAFFAENAPDTPLSTRFRMAFSAEPRAKRRARHVIDVLSRRAEHR